MQQEIRRILSALRQGIRDQKLTQLQVQNRLGWGRSSLSQLFTGQKRLRFDQLLAILQAIEIPPRRFFQELYGARSPEGTGDGSAHCADPPDLGRRPLD